MINNDTDSIEKLALDGLNDLSANSDDSSRANTGNNETESATVPQKFQQQVVDKTPEVASDKDNCGANPSDSFDEEEESSISEIFSM